MGRGTRVGKEGGRKLAGGCVGVWQPGGRWPKRGHQPVIGSPPGGHASQAQTAVTALSSEHHSTPHCHPSTASSLRRPCRYTATVSRWCPRHDDCRPRNAGGARAVVSPGPPGFPQGRVERPLDGWRMAKHRLGSSCMACIAQPRRAGK